MAPLTTLSTREHPETNLSLRSIASLNPFRKSLPPRPPPPTKHYEVFPGIWNTDATAKVFGYLDFDEPRLSKLTDESPIQRRKSNRRKHLQSPALARKLLNRYREVHTDDGTDDFSRRTHRQHVEAWESRRQERRDEAKREREASQRSAMRVRVRTLSRDDELVQRGANPRTGVVSPELLIDNNGESVGDGQIAVGYRKEPVRGKREGSGTWKQNDLGWSLIESPLSGPSAEDLGKESRVVLADKLLDQFVEEMPGVANPAPAETTPRQIHQYQERFRDIFISSRANPTEVVPRQWVPEGPRNRVQNTIPRKEVGSGRARRNGSTDTVIIQDQIRASSLSTPRKDNMRSRSVRIITPPTTQTSNSLHCSLSDRNDRDFDSGLHTEKLPSQITNSITQRGVDHLPEGKVPNTPTRPVLPSSKSWTPGKYVPRLDVLHPSQFSSLTASYRRPKDLQPARLRAVKTIENTSSGHDANLNAISGRRLRIKERSQMQPENCAAEIPRASLSNSEQETRRENLVHGIQPTTTSLLPTTPKASKTALKAHDDKIHKTRIVPHAPGIDVGDGARTDKKDGGTRNQLVKHSAAASCSCTKYDHSPSLAASEVMTTEKRLSPKTTNIARSPRQTKAGCDQVNKNIDKPSEGFPGVKIRSTIGARTQSTNKSPYPNSDSPPELDITGCDRVVCHRAKGVDDGKNDEQSKQSRIEGFVHEASNLGIVVGLWRLAALVEQKLYDSIRMRSIQRRLMEMIDHVLLTLHTSSPALEVLRMPNAKMEEYLTALKDVIRATFYLLVLLSLVMVVGKVLRFTAVVINLLWLPLKMVFLVARWFILG